MQREDNYVIDLGFKFSNSLDSNFHIDKMMCCKASKTFGFVMRPIKEFSQINTVKTLYCALVRPILEYGSLIWDLYTINGSLQVELVQLNFIKDASFILGIQCPSHDYSPVSKILDLQSVGDLKPMLSNTFPRGFLSNVDSYS